jgi:hypothetical protein
MVFFEKWKGWESGVDSWRASYNEIPARSRYTQCSRRLRGGERSDIEKRMPLLGCVRAGGSRARGHGRIPSHVNEAVEMILGVIGVKGRHLRAEVVNCYYGPHFVRHVGDMLRTIRYVVEVMLERGEKLVGDFAPRDKQDKHPTKKPYLNLLNLLPCISRFT